MTSKWTYGFLYAALGVRFVGFVLANVAAFIQILKCCGC